MTEEDIEQFLRDASDEDSERLAAIAERMRLHGHYRVLDAWLDSPTAQGTRDGDLLYALLGILDISDLEYTDVMTRIRNAMFPLLNVLRSDSF